MKLELNIDDVGSIVTDLYAYSGGGCDHGQLDPCCAFCRAKMVMHAWDENELQLNNDTNE